MVGSEEIESLFEVQEKVLEMKEKDRRVQGISRSVSANTKRELITRAGIT
jgi:hypothetical protein